MLNVDLYRVLFRVLCVPLPSTLQRRSLSLWAASNCSRVIIKTGLSRTKLSHLMDSETWMNAMKAKELGFCDEVLYTGDSKPDDVSGFSFARRTADACLMNRVIASMPRPAPVAVEPEPAPVEPEPEPTVPKPEPEPETDNRVKAADLEKRLALLK